MPTGKRVPTWHGTEQLVAGQHASADNRMRTALQANELEGVSVDQFQVKRSLLSWCS